MVSPIEKDLLNRSSSEKDFWDSLQADILNSNPQLSREDFLASIERSFMYSMLYRNLSQTELNSFQSIFNLRNNGYILLLELTPEDKSRIAQFQIDEYSLYYTLKKALIHTSSAISPVINNRISILITNDAKADSNQKNESLELCRKIIDTLKTELQLSVIIGIGTPRSICSIYTSFIEALKCIYYIKPDSALHIQDLDNSKNFHQFDYIETEKYMLEAIKARNLKAYDYFGMLIDWIKPFNDDAKRNKILELLVLVTHTMRVDSQNEMKFLNYTGQIKEFMDLKGEQLSEFAYQRFIYITGFIKPQNSIDYSNRIVQATKEFLEAHYTEDISLENVAEIVNISPQYFSKLIKKNTGFNFIDWLSMLRVKKAKELLTNSNFTVKEVCFMVGYKDPNYFSRIFKKRIGITPSEYVKNNAYFQQ